MYSTNAGHQLLNHRVRELEEKIQRFGWSPKMQPKFEEKKVEKLQTQINGIKKEFADLQGDAPILLNILEREWLATLRDRNRKKTTSSNRKKRCKLLKGTIGNLPAWKPSEKWLQNQVDRVATATAGDTKRRRDKRF